MTVYEIPNEPMGPVNMIPCGILTGENGEQGWPWVNSFNRDEQEEEG